MKLIYLANVGLPTDWAHGVQIMKMCEAFAEQGLEVELMAPRRRQFKREDLFVFFGVKNNFKIKFLPCLDLFPGSKASSVFWLRLTSFLLLAKVYLLFKSYDVLYTRDQATGLFFKKYYLEIHSLPDSIKNWHKKVWRRAKALFVLTGIMKEELTAAGLPEGKIFVAPDGVDLTLFDIPVSKADARQKLNLPLDEKIILYSGSFYQRGWKGVDVLLDSIKELPADYLVVLVGGQEKEIAEIKRSHPLNNVLLIGRRPHGEIPYYLKAADVLVLPNKKGERISEKYTSPMKLFEYLAARRPIVASDLPSLREILSAQNSFLVESNNPRALASRLKKVLANGSLAAEVAERAYNQAKDYTWDKRAAAIIKAINNSR